MQTIKLSDCDIVYNSNVGFVCYANHKGRQHKIYTNENQHCFIKIKGKRFYITINNIRSRLCDIQLLS